MNPWHSDVTSAGLDTFGGPLRDTPAPAGRRHRRTVTVLALGVLAVAGAAGSYVAVLNGLGTLLSAKPATPQPPAAQTVERRDAAATSGLGRGRARQVIPPAPVAPSTVLVVPPTTAATTTRAPLPTRTVPPSPPSAAAPTPSTPDCGDDCMTPPVPTPTAPPEPSDSAEPSPSPSESVEPTPSETPEPAQISDSPRPHQHPRPSDEADKSGHSRRPSQ